MHRYIVGTAVLITSNDMISCITSLINYQSNCFINGHFFFFLLISFYDSLSSY